MKMQVSLYTVCLPSFCSAALGMALGFEIFSHMAIHVLRVRHIQIEDSEGAIKATLQVENGGTYLRFLTPDKNDAVVLGESELHDTLSNRVVVTPNLQFNDRNGQSSLRISTDKAGNGFLAFDDAKRVNTMVLGHFPLSEQPAPRYAWGVSISREYGETGVGIVDTPGLPVDYISPVPHAKP
jgi:hypothetical protein